MADLGVVHNEDIDLDIPHNLSASEDEEDNVDEQQHSKLLDAIHSLDKKKRIVTLRSESSTKVSEFQLTEGDKDKLKLNELVGSLKKLKELGVLKKQLNAVQNRAQTLDTPLAKPQADKIKRIVAYEKVNKEVSKWDKVVLQNRLADQLQFPLIQPNFRLQPSDEFVKKFKPSTSLEMQVAALLHGSQNVLTKDTELTLAEQRAMEAKSLSEAIACRKELQKMRALISYKEAKLKRHSKIKSKKYHRHLKHRRMKEEMKLFEDLKTKDPAAAIEKFKELDLLRIQERVTLRHKNTGKWAKQHALRRKYDKNSREALIEQLQLSRELTRKLVVPSSSEDEDEVVVKRNEVSGVELKSLQQQLISKSNPWLKNNSLSVDIQQMTSKNRPHPLLSTSDSVQNVDATKISNNVELKNILNELEKDLTKETNVEHMEVGTDSKKYEEKTQDKDKNEIIANRKESLKRKISEDFDEEDIDEIFDKMLNKKLKAIEKKITNKTKVSRKQKIATKKRMIGKKSTQQSDKGKRSTKQASKEKKSVKQAGKGKKSRTQNEVERSEKIIIESLNRKQTLEDMDEMLNEDKDRPVFNLSLDNSKMVPEDVAVSIDPNKLIIKSQKIKTKAINLIDEDEEEEDSEEKVKHMTISEAFADLDIVKEFQEEKKNVENKDKPKDIDLALPGWGSWTGANIKPSEAKKQRFIIKVPQAPPRKDRGLGHVIISEVKNTSISKHQVNEIPASYQSIKTFEKSIRAPLGKTWNTETAVRSFTLPKISTLAGTIISPIDPSNIFECGVKEETFKKRWKNKRVRFKK